MKCIFPLVALWIGLGVAGCRASCPIGSCSSGESLDEDQCICVTQVVPHAGAKDGGLSCSMPVTCSDAKMCDWATAQKPETWCDPTSPNDLPSPVRIEQCDDGYTGISSSGLDSSTTYYYQGNSLVAVVTSAIGQDYCSQGPADFRAPKCGSWRELCPRTGGDAGEDEPAPIDGGGSDTTRDVSSDRCADSGRFDCAISCMHQEGFPAICTSDGWQCPRGTIPIPRCAPCGFGGVAPDGGCLAADAAMTRYFLCGRPFDGGTLGNPVICDVDSEYCRIDSSDVGMSFACVPMLGCGPDAASACECLHATCTGTCSASTNGYGISLTYVCGG